MASSSCPQSWRTSALVAVASLQAVFVAELFVMRLFVLRGLVSRDELTGPVGSFKS